MAAKHRFESLRLESVFKKMEGFELGADFSVGEGERAALIGRSGMGKTTLLRLIAGLDRLDGPEDRGRILLGSEDLSVLDPRERRIGFVFQDSALFPGLTVLENVSFGLKMQGVARARRDEEGLFWLEKVGLGGQARAPVSRLSGGEMQRVAFIRALIWKPRLLLLDEPFSALDTDLRDSLRRELLDLHSLWPVPLVLVSHDRADLDAIATTKLEIVQEPGSEIRSVQRLKS